MSVILMCLKIVGLIVLGIIGLVLLLALLLLFVPFRYKGGCSIDTRNYDTKADVSWLLGLIKLKTEYNNGGLCYNAYVLGIKVYSSED